MSHKTTSSSFSFSPFLMEKPIKQIIPSAVHRTHWSILFIEYKEDEKFAPPPCIKSRKNHSVVCHRYQRESRSPERSLGQNNLLLPLLMPHIQSLSPAPPSSPCHYHLPTLLHFQHPPPGSALGLLQWWPADWYPASPSLAMKTRSDQFSLSPIPPPALPLHLAKNRKTLNGPQGAMQRCPHFSSNLIPWRCVLVHYTSNTCFLHRSLTSGLCFHFHQTTVLP